jgi:gamma-F420-2:alpha-L-glutamate ligase
MKIWFLWEGQLESEVPGSYEMRRLLEVGKVRGHDVRVFDPRQVKILCGDTDHVNIFVDGLGREKPDIVMARMGSATTYLCHAVLRHMSRNNVMVINHSSAVENAADKLRCMQILANKNVPIPRTMFARCPVDSELITQKIGYPVIVKTLKGTQGGGIFLAETADKLRDLSEILVHQGIDDAPVLFQEFISSSSGRDIRAFVVGKKVLACMERKSTDGSFKSNITRGGVGQPVETTPQIEKIAVDTAEALGLEVAGIDLLYADDGFKICEANSAPDFRGLEKFCNVSVPEAIYDFMEEKHRKHLRENSRKSGFLQRIINMGKAA